MDKLLMQGYQKVIKLAIDIDPEMSIRIFYDKMTQQEIDGRCFATSDRTVNRYLELKDEAGKNYNRFLKYSAEILGLNVGALIGGAKLYIKYKNSKPEEEIFDDLKSYIKYVKDTQLKTLEYIDSKPFYRVMFYRFMVNSEESERQRLFYLYSKCLTGFSNEMLDFLSKVFFYENIDSISKWKDKLSSARIRINSLNIHQNKNLCTLFEIQHHYEYSENVVQMEPSLKDIEKVLWIVDFHLALKEKRNDLDIIFNYALLNPPKKKRWIIS